MQPSSPPAIAIIADAHFHDLLGDFGTAGVTIDGQAMALRPFGDTAKSTRVFNESGRALRHALDDICARGIRHVVLLGDYSDDGQAVTIKGLSDMLDDYSNGHGIRFLATPGNHDMFGPGGRHRMKRFLNAAGGVDLVTSNPEHCAGREQDALIVTAGMRCAGYPDGLQSLPNAGWFRMADDLHWETPFGQDDALSARRYEVASPDGGTRRWLTDASYLVEPIDGIWMLMIDANVFVPLDGAAPDDDAGLADSTDAGWNAMLLHKRFILDWAKDVSKRASTLGKTLIAFSHYPALDPLDGTGDDERAVLGQTSLMPRIPSADVGAALIDAGIQLHFSGHLHINDTARQRNDEGYVVNVSVPSLVAFPPAYKIIRPEPGRIAVETVEIADMVLDPGIMMAYRREAERSGIEARALLDTSSYGSFLAEHIGHLVGRRHMRREWPLELAEAARALNLAELALLALCETPLPLCDLKAALGKVRENPDLGRRLTDAAMSAGIDPCRLARTDVMTFLRDWYRVRMGSDLGSDVIAADDLMGYRFLSGLYAGQEAKEGSAQAAFGRLFRMFERFTSGLPSRNFAIDLASGEIEPLSS